MSREGLLTALLVLLVVLGGCSEADPPAPESDTRDCNFSSLAYWHVDDYHGWTPDTLRVGYELSGPADVFLVAYENETVRGVKHVTADRAVATDGSPVRLDQPLTGNHTVRVTGYRDADGDGQFAPQTDTRCAVETPSLTLDFSALTGTTTSS